MGPNVSATEAKIILAVLGLFLAGGVFVGVVKFLAWWRVAFGGC
jgi:hypothetical protein